MERPYAVVGHILKALVTAGHQPVALVRSAAAYVFEDAQHAADLFDLNRFGNIYTRIMNPTNAVFEERVASLEGGVGALATASGLAAQAMAITTLLEAGDEIVASTHLYGGSHNQMSVTLAKFGITTTFVPPDDMDGWRAAITPRTRLLYGETIGNPGLDVLDIRAVADVADAAGLPLMVDNTFATPYLCRPFEHGAHLVTHSATKWIGGHGTSIGGVLVDSGRFDWSAGMFPGLVEPSAGYRGMRFVETFGNFAFIMKARVETMRDLGPAMSPFNAFLLLQGLETLSLRMDRHVQNAVAVAGFLRDHAAVEWVNYPGLPQSPTRALAERYLPKGAGSMVTFGIRGGRAAGERFIEACELCSHLANVGDAKTLVIHPASTTHRRLDEQALAASGVTEDMIRISVGIESVDDILWDLQRALGGADG